MWFSKRDEAPSFDAHLGLAKAVVGPAEMVEGKGSGIGITLPEAPDYEALASRQIEAASSFPVFHQVGVGMFSHESACAFKGHLAELEEALCRYMGLLETAYSTSVLEAGVLVRQRLSELSRDDHGSKRAGRDQED